MTMEKKKESLDLMFQQVEKQFGKGALMRLGDREAVFEMRVIPTGIMAIDVALGVGGLPRGRVVEIYGTEASGKTSLALHVVAECQALGGTVAFIDAEHALDPSYARAIGVDIDELLISQPDTGEQALEIGEVLVRSGAVELVVIDSVAALVPRAEIEGEMGDVHVGLQARLMSQALRKLTAAIHRSDAVVIFINQMRDKIGVMYGPSTTTSGGRALKFYSTVRIEIRRMSSIKVGQDIIGAVALVKIVKNKVAPPFRNCETDIIFGKGFSRVGSIIDVAVDKKIVKKAGSWYSFGDEKLGQGKENSREFLEANPDILEEIKEQVLLATGLKKDDSDTSDTDDGATNGNPAEDKT
jgi:recombination protein RecA